MSNIIAFPEPSQEDAISRELRAASEVYRDHPVEDGTDAIMATIHANAPNTPRNRVRAGLGWVACGVMALIMITRPTPMPTPDKAQLMAEQAAMLRDLEKVRQRLL